MKFILLTLLFSPVLLSLKPAPSDDYIDWGSKRLEWSDYLSKPDPSSDAAATTTTYLGVEYKISKSVFSYKIACRFSKEKSWGLYRTAYILSHEQGHFDITEIYARELHKRLAAYEFNKRTFEKDLKKIYENVMRDKEEFQKQYDEETDYSRNKKMQLEWLDKIEQILDDTEALSNYDRID